QQLERLRGELAERRSRLRSLEEIQQRFEGVGEGVRALMRASGADERARDAKGILGLVADRIECPPELTEALAAALGERLSHVVARDRAAAREAFDFLEGGKRGRATVVQQLPRRVVAPPALLPDDPGVIGWLADSIGAAPGDRGLVRHLLDGVLVVEDFEAAGRLHDRGVSATIVTRAGQLLGPDGSITAGRGEGASAHMIAVKREIRELAVIVGR